MVRYDAARKLAAALFLLHGLIAASRRGHLFGSGRLAGWNMEDRL